MRRVGNVRDNQVRRQALPKEAVRLETISTSDTRLLVSPQDNWPAPTYYLGCLWDYGSLLLVVMVLLSSKSFDINPQAKHVPARLDKCNRPKRHKHRTHPASSGTNETL